MTREILNKFSIGDSVHVDAKVIGIQILEDGSMLYSVDICTDSEDTLERVYDIPECFLAKGF